MADQGKDSPEALREAIDRYNAVWNEHDPEAIVSMHAPDMIFENHTADESAEGDAVRDT
jgi:ketosteroid isomerase-like protein